MRTQKDKRREKGRRGMTGHIRNVQIWGLNRHKGVWRLEKGANMILILKTRKERRKEWGKGGRR